FAAFRARRDGRLRRVASSGGCVGFPRDRRSAPQHSLRPVQYAAYSSRRRFRPPALAARLSINRDGPGLSRSPPGSLTRTPAEPRRGTGSRARGYSGRLRIDHRQDHLRRMVAIVVNRVIGRNHAAVLAERVASIGVEVEPGIIAARDIHANAVTFLEYVR